MHAEEAIGVEGPPHAAALSAYFAKRACSLATYGARPLILKYFALVGFVGNSVG